MTPAAFRKLALALPETEERAHMAHPDFRVANKIFATLGYPDGGWAMVKLSLEQQHNFVQTYPAIFQPVPGGWGRKGATKVNLGKGDAATVRLALIAAWRHTAPKRLVAQWDAVTR
jgi:hypothetical protein